MAIRLPRMVSSKKVPKGYFAVYVGESQKRLVIPVSFLNHPSFQDLLGKSEEEFGYSHPTGGLTIPCNEDTFLEVTSRMIVEEGVAAYSMYSSENGQDKAKIRKSPEAKRTLCGKSVGQNLITYYIGSKAVERWS
ncbi:hypothetical protein GOBAR_AA04588 [Gossypium barbadense]|uniref:Uncharacterized protein n=1 Tax=Gossypium barbadense TaxID=3634 RepID=A0A2P5YK76_GOSBA|nr:hypothetical protein GOBAR_AA04588 [Gossypium barbadense]